MAKVMTSVRVCGHNAIGVAPRENEKIERPVCGGGRQEQVPTLRVWSESPAGVVAMQLLDLRIDWASLTGVTWSDGSLLDVIHAGTYGAWEYDMVEWKKRKKPAKIIADNGDVSRIQRRCVNGWDVCFRDKCAYWAHTHIVVTLTERIIERRPRERKFTQEKHSGHGLALNSSFRAEHVGPCFAKDVAADGTWKGMASGSAAVQQVKGRFRACRDENWCCKVFQEHSCLSGSIIAIWE